MHTTFSTSGDLPTAKVSRHLGNLAFDALLPVLMYLLARYSGTSEVHAILYAGCIPILSGLWTVRRGLTLSPTSVVVLAGFVVTLVAFILGGSPQVLLIRESLVTATLGLACLLSLLTRRPLMFFFARHLLVGTDPTASAAFTKRLDTKEILRGFRMITFAWSLTLLSGFGARAWLIFHAPPSMVLAISPFINTGVILGTLSWAFWYAKRRKLLA